KSDDKKPDYMGKPQFYPKVFDIDISVCMSCQICVEVCPFEAIKMDKDFELSKRERFNLLLQRKEELSKPNEYYHSICPTEADNCLQPRILVYAKNHSWSLVNFQFIDGRTGEQVTKCLHARYHFLAELFLSNLLHRAGDELEIGIESDIEFNFVPNVGKKRPR